LSPVRPEDRDEIVARINRKYEGDIRKGNEYEAVQGISTRSPELDAAMGGLGVPEGRWTRFYGGYHSCKTLTALNVTAEAQEMGRLCAYYNLEKQYDEVFAREKIGVNTDELEVVEGTTIEEVGEKMEALFGVCHLHVIDSCSIAVSEDELDADIRDWRPGITARAWGKVFRRLNERFDHVQNTVIMLDQVRVNFKTGGEDAPGGRILDHQSSMTVHFRKGGWLYRNADGFLDEKAKIEKGSSGQAEPSGIEIKARVEKSRVSRPFRTATMRLDLDELSFDRVFEITKMAKHYKIVENRGAWYYYTPPGSDKELKFQGEKELREFARGDVTFQEQVRDTVMALIRR
jgi:protein RecA